MLDTLDAPDQIATFLDQHNVHMHHDEHVLRVLHDPAHDVLVLLVEDKAEAEGPTSLYIHPMRRVPGAPERAGRSAVPGWATDYTRRVLGERIAFRDFAPTEREHAEALLARVYDAMVREAHVLPGQLPLTPQASR